MEFAPEESEISFDFGGEVFAVEAGGGMIGGDKSASADFQDTATSLVNRFCAEHPFNGDETEQEDEPGINQVSI